MIAALGVRASAGVLRLRLVAIGHQTREYDAMCEQKMGQIASQTQGRLLPTVYHRLHFFSQKFLCSP
jgi:hypothetical protein